ncbi:MAG: hypothetical protein ACO1Q7_06405 [Gemmatimonas sp.]
MSFVVDVWTVLRDSVSEHYSNLLTRPTGAAVRDEIERRVVEVGSPVITTIDFSQIDLIDVSCADEIVAKLLLRYYEGVNGLTGYLLLQGIREDHLDAIDAVLEKRGLALVAWHDGQAELHGIVDDTARRHWEIVREMGPITTDRVSEQLGTTEVASANYLTQLWSRRLLRYEEAHFTVPGTTEHRHEQ